MSVAANRITTCGLVVFRSIGKFLPAIAVTVKSYLNETAELRGFGEGGGVIEMVAFIDSFGGINIERLKKQLDIRIKLGEIKAGQLR